MGAGSLSGNILIPNSPVWVRDTLSITAGEIVFRARSSGAVLPLVVAISTVCVSIAHPRLGNAPPGWRHIIYTEKLRTWAAVALWNQSTWESETTGALLSAGKFILSHYFSCFMLLNSLRDKRKWGENKLTHQIAMVTIDHNKNTANNFNCFGPWIFSKVRNKHNKIPHFVFHKINVRSYFSLKASINSHFVNWIPKMPYVW